MCCTAGLNHMVCRACSWLAAHLILLAVQHPRFRILKPHRAGVPPPPPRLPRRHPFAACGWLACKQRLRGADAGDAVLRRQCYQRCTPLPCAALQRLARGRGLSFIKARTPRPRTRAQAPRESKLPHGCMRAPALQRRSHSVASVATLHHMWRAQETWTKTGSSPWLRLGTHVVTCTRLPERPSPPPHRVQRGGHHTSHTSCTMAVQVPSPQAQPVLV